MDTTNEFSFILKPSEYGVGVFAVHDIKEGTFLRLFGEEDSVEYRNEKDIPEVFREFCVSHENGKAICPKDFGHMAVGWYINHSKNNHNAYHRDLYWYSERDIKAGEEILIDYNSLGEPTEMREEYYKN